MATAVANRFANSSQLYFDWVHEDESSPSLPTRLQGPLSADLTSRGVSKGNKQLRFGEPDQLMTFGGRRTQDRPSESCITMFRSSCSDRASELSSRQTCWAPTAPEQSEKMPIPNRQSSWKEERTGIVKLGDVMLRLLKRYGITEEEIAEALAPECSTIQ
jgi:hypothetical protein